MMQLANMEALGDGFITERWGSKADEYKRDKVDGVEKKAGDKDHHYKDYEDDTGAKKGDKSDTGRGVDYVDENLQEQEEELELGAAEEEIAEIPGDEGEEAFGDEGDEGEEAEVTITDEEAQDIIDLADKLRDAVGDEGAEEELPPEGGEEVEMEMGAEEEVGLEEPAGGHGMYEDNDELYEAALRGMDLTIVDDKAKRKEAMLQEVKKRIYKRVVGRLLKEGRKR